MKGFIAFLVVLVGVQAITEEQLRKADEHTKICSEKSGLEYDVATKFRYAVIGDESEGHQCFARCFFERSGFMNEEGVMQKDVMLAKLGLEKDDETKLKLSNLIEKCTALSGDSICNTAFKVHNCYWSHIVLPA